MVEIESERKSKRALKSLTRSPANLPVGYLGRTEAKHSKITLDINIITVGLCWTDGCVYAYIYHLYK